MSDDLRRRLDELRIAFAAFEQAHEDEPSYHLGLPESAEVIEAARRLLVAAALREAPEAAPPDREQRLEQALRSALLRLHDTHRTFAACGPSYDDCYVCGYGYRDLLKKAAARAAAPEPKP